MAYIPGHSAVVAYAFDGGTITETNNDIATALPALPSEGSIKIIGYSNVPEVQEALGNKKGFGIGSPVALYNAKGRRSYDISMELKVADKQFLQACVRNAATQVLPQMVIYVGVAGQQSDAYRFAVCDQLTLAFQEGDAQELTASVKLKAIAKQVAAGPALTPDLAVLTSYGSPLMWHDVKFMTINGLDYRDSFMGLNITLANNLELKGERPNWGDNAPLSRTAYHLLPHLVNVSGELSLHKALPPGLVTNALDAHNWGDIVVTCSDLASHSYEVTLQGVMPDSVTHKGGDASSQLSHSANITANNIIIS